MGENKHIKELDTFAKKYVKEIELEKTSANFTTSIMNSIIEEKRSHVFKAMPLISKKGWFFIAVLVCSILTLSVATSKKDNIIFSEIDFSFFYKFQIPSMFETISISNVVLYSISLFGLFIIAQLFLLKKHFEKRYN